MPSDGTTSDRSHASRRTRFLVLATVTSLVAALPAAAVTEEPSAGSSLQAREVRTVYTSEFGVPRPRGLAYDPGAGFIVAGTAESRTSVVRLGVGEELLGSLVLPGLAGDALATLTVDRDAGDLVRLEGRELARVPVERPVGPRVRTERSRIVGPPATAPSGAAYDAEGTLLLLDGEAGELVPVVTSTDDVAAPVPLDVGDGDLKGLAFNPEDGLLYVLSAGNGELYAVDADGELQRTYDLSDVPLLDPQAMVFAPTSGGNDDPEAMNLFIADAGDDSSLGGVVEVTLAQVTAAAVDEVTAQLVQTIDTSKWVPASPDPSGVTYLPASDRLTVVDSEVNEVTGAGYHGVNVWEVSRTGVVHRGWNTLSFTNEPTGVGHDPATNTLFISTDSGNRGIHIIRAGPDGLFGTGDDVRTFFNALTAVGVNDVEEPEFDPASGHLFFADGVGTRIYRINPVDGVFANGNDIITSFDVGQFGATDVEGLALNQATGTLLVGDRRSRRIYEVTKTGTLVRIIDARVPGMTFLSGMSTAPASNGSGRTNIWITDRAEDNGPNPNENDGKLFEVTVGPTGNTPPVISSVSITPSSPRTNDTVTATVVATDADGDPLTYAYQWRKNGVELPGRTGTSLDLSAPGNGDRGDAISVRVTVSDGPSQDVRTSSQVTIVNTPPVFAQDLPNRTDQEGATVSFSAGAFDADGDGLSYTATGLPAGIGINASTGAISGTLAAGSAAAGPYQVAVSVTDGGAPPPTEPSQPIRLVQSKAGDLSGTTTFSLMYDQPPTQGNLLVATGAYSASRTPSIPSGWSIASDTGRSVVFYRVAGPSEPSAVTYSISGADTFMGLTLLEYEGMNNVQSQVLDRSVSEIGSGTSVSTGTTQVTTQADELLVASVGLNGTRTFSSWTNGFNQRANARRQAVADRVVSATGQFETSASWDSSVNFAVGSLVTFRAAGAGSPPPAPAPGSATDTFTWTVTAPDPGPSAPVVSQVSVTPTSPTTNATVTASVSASGGGGPLTYSYQWLKNGLPLAGATGSTLDLSVAGNGDKGDQIAVRVVASDGTRSSQPATSTAVTVVNTPPTFDQDLPNRSDAEGSPVSFSAGASDADGDVLTYGASGLPPGISVNTATGVISGTIAAGAAASSPYSVSVTVRDGPVVAATDTFTWTVTAPDPGPSAPTGLIGTATSISVDLTWSSGGVAGHHVYRGTSPTGPFIRLTASPTTVTSYRDTAAPIGAISYYRVTALDTAGRESEPAATSAERRIAFRSSETASDRNIGSISVARPAGVTQGDVLIAALTTSGALPTTPSGWTVVRNDASSTIRQVVYVKAAGANEPTSYAWSLPSGTTVTAIVSAYRGVDTSQPVDVAGGRVNVSTRAIEAPSVTATVPDTLLVGFFGIASNGSLNPPSGMINQVAVSQSSGSTKLAAVTADEVRHLIGPTGTRTATATSGPTADNIGQLVALRPAAR